MIYKAIAISLVCIGLAGCNHSASHVLSQLTIATVGHDTPFVAADEPPEDAAAPPVEPVVEPPVYVPPPEPPKVPCTEGQFRVYFCVNGFREYI